MLPCQAKKSGCIGVNRIIRVFVLKGTGKFEGIKGDGTYKYWVVGPGQWYSDGEGEYTLP